MKHWNRDNIIDRINEVLPPGKVLPMHNDKGHFYGVRNNMEPDEYIVYPSVTGKLQILKDEGLINYKMNRAIEYLKNFIFSNVSRLSKMDDGAVMAELDTAEKMAARVSQDILEDAGDVGRMVHGTREIIFEKWIKENKKPEDFLSLIPAEYDDVRVVSAIRALKKFCDEWNYTPVACELLVYDRDLETAGTLDDLGLVRVNIKEGDPTCEHEYITSMSGGEYRCAKCDRKDRDEFVLMDLKTSNQFKDHYFFQVALYWRMFWKLMGKEWKPEKALIVKVSKEDGTYKVEELKQLPRLAQYALHMIKTNEAVAFIKSIRKDNQKVVAPLMQL